MLTRPTTTGHPGGVLGWILKNCLPGRRTDDTTQMPDQNDAHPIPPAVRVFWAFIALVWALVFAALLSYSPSDVFGHASSSISETPLNWIGAVGAFLSHELIGILGIGSWALLGAALIAIVHVGFVGPISHPGVRTVGIFLVAISLPTAHALLLPNLSRMPEGAGGLVGIAFADILSTSLGTLGSVLTLAAAGLLGLWVAYDRLIYDLPAMGAKKLGVVIASAAGKTRESLATAMPRRNDIDDDSRLGSVNTLMRSAAKQGRAGKASTKAPKSQLRDEEDDDGMPNAPAVVAAGRDLQVDPEPEYEDEYLEEDEHELDEDELREKIAALPVRFAQSERTSATEADLEQLRAQRKSEEEADRNYNFPTIDLLSEPDTNFSDELESWVREQAQALEQALQTYRIDGEVVGIDSGPVITLYRVRLAPGTKVSQLNPITSDIARMLKAVNIRIVPNEEGQDTVGIEVPNRKKEKVRLKELMTQSASASRMKLPMFLGKDASGNPLVIDLASLPHMLIAGTTGSGKSVCMNAILMGFLYTQKPSDLKLVLVDPKMVELSQFKDIPHLMTPVVTEMSKAAAILEWAVAKMDERYELLAEAGCRDLASYNDLSWVELKERFNPGTELEEARIPRKLPYMVFVIDELADLMMTNKEVEGSIVRIAQKARAVGIHLILATQRPQANVVTGLIKSNMPGRLSFRVASGMDSRIVLDQKGGELLLGHGDMLMLTPRSSVPIRAQGTLVDDGEIRSVVKYVKNVSGPTFERELTTIADHGYDQSEQNHERGTAEEYEERMRKHAQEDPLFDRAVEIVLETRRGSVSLLQRRLAIGYTRASRLIELMGLAGIIGDHKGSVARDVTLTLDDWHRMKELAEKREAEEAMQDGESDEDSLFAQHSDEALSADGDTDGMIAEDDAPPFEPNDDVQMLGQVAVQNGSGESAASILEPKGVESEDADVYGVQSDEERLSAEGHTSQDEVNDSGTRTHVDEDDELVVEEYEEQFVYLDEDGNEIPADQLEGVEFEESDENQVSNERSEEERLDR